MELVYDDRGNTVRMLGPSPEHDVTMTYDATGRLETRLEVNGTTSFTYGDAGRLVEKETEGLTHNGVQAYAYDDAGRLTASSQANAPRAGSPRGGRNRPTADQTGIDG